jgi:adenylate cyclase
VENKLPYDVVFILNRYFEAVGTAIERAGGVTSLFMGDGVMALFDPKDAATGGCREAVHAAHLMAEAVSVLSEELADELNEPMRIGIGIHAGSAVVGRMGWGESFHLTAVGDTINVAARLEQATKDYGAELVISEAAAVLAGLDVRAFDQHDLTVRNRAQPVLVRVIPRVSDLGAPPAGGGGPSLGVVSH